MLVLALLRVDLLVIFISESVAMPRAVFRASAFFGARSVSEKPASTLRSKRRARYSRIMQCSVDIPRPARLNPRRSERTIQRYETIPPPGFGLCFCLNGLAGDGPRATSTVYSRRTVPFTIRQFKIAGLEIFHWATRQQALPQF